MRLCALIGLVMLCVAPVVSGGEIGYVEEFALARDREEALKQLIPGTEDYYFYHCLHYQHTGRPEKVQELLTLWIKRYGYTQRVEEIRNRQALLEYDRNQDGALKLLRERLGLYFNHQKVELEQKVSLPTALDQNQISFERFADEALSSRQDTSRFKDSAFDHLVRAKLNSDQMRHLLSRLQRPDYPDLPRIIVEDLRYRYSRGFGSHPVHHALLVDQLEECLKLDPDLIKNTNFINIYLKKLQPGADVDWQRDPEEEQAYLARLETFARRLPPVQNSLKAHVLYRQLLNEVKRGIYEHDRFMEYIRLPRPAPYINTDYLKRREFVGYMADLNQDFSAYTQLPPVGADEELVRDCLMHFLRDAADFKAYEEFLDHNYLKDIFAETKMINGIGDMEQWYSMLSPEKVRAIRDRVDMTLLASNPEFVLEADPVGLKLAVKNVEKLIVKTFEVNTHNYYREHMDEISTAIDLDGLVANVEEAVTYGQPPMLRHVETFVFPQIKKPGVYVVEFIGNGISSRALIRKGRLTFAERVGSAGHVFTVYDGTGVKLKDAALWLAGHEYTADADGEIAVPFSTKPGPQDIILSYGDFSALGRFTHLGENYSLAAGFHAERESLLGGETCRVVVRPELTVNGVHVGLDLIEEPTLVIRSTDIEGISSTSEIKDFALHDEKESVYEFKVPADLVGLRFDLRGKVKKLADNSKIELRAGADVPINGIDRTEKTEMLHLRRTAGGYLVELLGKSGEPRADRPVYFTFMHRDFTESRHIALKTDERGRVTLGALDDIDLVTARGPENTSQSWPMPADTCTHRPVIHALVGDPIQVACMDAMPADPALGVSLLEMRGDTFCADRRAHVKVGDGFLVITGLAAGDYSLWIKPSGRFTTIRVTAGRREGRQLLSKHRVLEQVAGKPLQIQAIEPGEKNVVITLANASAMTRVHVVATRFVGEATLYNGVGAPSVRSPVFAPFLLPRSFYVSGRNIGDEYRYILERKYADRYPGNMLKRPSLLLNPWSLRKTDTGTDQAEGPEIMRGIYGSRSPGSGGRAGGVWAGGGVQPGFATLDFLPTISPVLENLVPDKDGRVEVPRTALGAGQQLHVLAVNTGDAVYRQVALAEQKETFRDRRLMKILNPAGHFSEQKKNSVAKAGAVFAIDDIRTSKLEVYDSLVRVYGLFSTLSKDPTLTEFGFILSWPELADAEKLEMYSKYACHELNFFLYHKDPEFFGKVIAPYLADKKDKTFLDHWLLGDKLDAYLAPWAFGRLNIVERALLARRIREEQSGMARHVKDLFDLIPPDIERFNYLFKTALQASALEVGGLASTIGRLEEAALDASDEFGDARFARSMGAHAAGAPVEIVAAKMVRKSEAAEFKGQAELAQPMAAAADEMELSDGAFVAGNEKDSARRQAVRQLYRKLDKTEEWVENNYYHLPIEQQVAGLVTVNAFWKDYAAFTGETGFLSEHLAEASRSFTEMMLALAVIDLPFKSGEHKTELKGVRLELTPATGAVIFHREIRDAAVLDGAQVILLSQNFFALDDRYRHEDNERFDKFVTDEFQSARVYGAQIVLTNPTSTRRKVDVLLQIPEGAMPVGSGFFTRSLHRQLAPYSTQTIEYHFYFPTPGSFRHYPVHVAQNDSLIVSTQPFVFDVKAKLTNVDTESWAYLSQHGDEAQVLRYLDDHNIDRLDLDQIAFRMRDRAFFDKVIPLLAQRHVYNEVLWSYGIYHKHAPTIREYLPHTSFAAQCGLFIDNPLLTLDPVERHVYQHREYWPLVNARVYQLGRKRKILNQQFSEQYEQLMAILGYKPALDDADRMAVTIYLLLQDRVTEGLEFFDSIASKKLHTDIQYDYLKAYVDFYRESPAAAAELAKRYETHPVKRWRNMFQDVIAQAGEIAGGAAKVIDEEDRTQQQTSLADTGPGLDLKVENRVATIHYRNLAACDVNFYLMDIELLFSRQPFVQEVGARFSVIKPNRTMPLQLAKNKDKVELELPQEFRDRNVMIEVSAAGLRRMQAYYPNSLTVQLMENYGQVRVTHEKTGKPLSKVYVKVYARMQGGAVQFFKDGYTDLRGRFDYTSLNTDELDHVDRFSVLIMSDEHGAVVREAGPPKR